MLNADQVQLLLRELSRARAESLALQELVAALMAGVAMLQDDPANFLGQMIESERGAGLAAATEAPDELLADQNYKNAMADKAAVREIVFDLAPKVLRRMRATRN